MCTDNKAHAPATLQLHTGTLANSLPSMGSWISYGLGTENENLPSFITIHPPDDVRNYGSSFLPAAHQGTPLNVSINDRASATRRPTGTATPVYWPVGSARPACVSFR